MDEIHISETNVILPVSVQWESPVLRSSSSQNREACASGTNVRVVQRAAYREKEALTITEPTQAFRYLLLKAYTTEKKLYN